MNDIQAAIVFATMILGIISIFIAKREHNKTEMTMDSNNFTIRESKTINILCIIMFISGAILLYFPLIFLCTIPIISLLRWKIQIKDNQITYTPAFGKKKTFNFSYITTATQKIRHLKGTETTYIYAYHEDTFYTKPEKLFYVASIDPGFNLLVSRLENAKIPIKGRPYKTETAK